jgi:GNAT superfamily N-acetyltransferase
MTSALPLLGTIWPRLPAAIERARAWGADWDAHSQPFVHVEDNEVIAHTGVLPITPSVAGIHAVCVHPRHRGRGLLRQTMARALEWVDARYPSAVLWANDAAIYGRFGFSERAETMFVGKPAGSAAETMAIAPDHPRVRQAIGWLGLINLALMNPLPSIALVEDSLVIYEIRGRVLRLYHADRVVEPGSGYDSIESFLPAEGFTPAPTPLKDFFMVRGAETPRFPPLSRC